MDQEFHVDVEEVRRSVEAAEVISLYFPYFRKTLLIDSRVSDVDPPMVRVVEMVRSADERLKELRRLRPRFGRPKAITLIPWPRFVTSVKTQGVWQILLDRLTASGGPALGTALERCYRELLREERAELRRAITGEGYRALWERVRRGT